MLILIIAYGMGMVHGVQGVENATNRKLSRVSRQTIHYYQKILCTKEEKVVLCCWEFFAKGKSSGSNINAINICTYIGQGWWWWIVDGMEVFYGVFFFSFSEDEEKRSEPLLLSLYCRYVGMMMVEKAERDNNRQYNNVHIVVICVLYCVHYIICNGHIPKEHIRCLLEIMSFYFIVLVSSYFLLPDYLPSSFSPVDILLAFSSAVSKGVEQQRERVVPLLLFHCLVLVASLLEYYVFL